METNPRERVWLSRAAVENWARLQSPIPATLADARIALVETVEALGVIRVEPPEWMTSAPEADAWLSLPGEVSLLLKRDEEGSSGREFIAVNSRAPKRKKAGAGRAPANAPMRAPDDLADPSARRALVTVSTHARDRLRERGGLEWDDEEWWARIEAAGLSRLPAWADASGSGGWALTWEEDSERWAAVVRPFAGTDRWVIPTVLRRSWVEDDLDEARADRGMIEVSSTVTEWWGEGWDSEGLIAPILLQVDDAPGPWLVTERGAIRLYPADASQRARGVRWVAQRPPG